MMQQSVIFSYSYIKNGALLALETLLASNLQARNGLAQSAITTRYMIFLEKKDCYFPRIQNKKGYRCIKMTTLPHLPSDLRYLPRSKTKSSCP